LSAVLREEKALVIWVRSVTGPFLASPLILRFTAPKCPSHW